MKVLPVPVANVNRIFFFIAQAVPIFRIGYFINAWLGLFNMIPFGNFDGKKILAWSKAWWVGGVVIGLLLLFVFYGYFLEITKLNIIK